MAEFVDTILSDIVLHKVGNKGREEGIRFSKQPLELSDEIKDVLLRYFLYPFKNSEYFHLFHESDVNLNEVFVYASAIFSDPEDIFEQSRNLAQHLYEQSTHAKVREGEFYTVYLENCTVEGEEVSALGLFKSESRDTYLKVYPTSESFALESEDGININKLDKGCIIFNTAKDDGYLVAVVDNLSKGTEALYWKDDFLKIRQREDNFFHTQNVMKLCKDFVTQKLPQEFEISKADQADLLNKSMSFFKEKDDFSFGNFASEVINQPEIIETFNDYKKEYESEYALQVADEFKISGEAVKKQARIYKSIIKLDKNFHIYIHGDREMITKGVDPKTGLNYYQLYFKEEI